MNDTTAPPRLENVRRKVRSLPTPKALRPPAQGCGEAATLGRMRKNRTNPNEVVAFFACDNRIGSTRRNDRATTPLGLATYRPPTQGSAFGATLGFAPKPLRGSNQNRGDPPNIRRKCHGPNPLPHVGEGFTHTLLHARDAPSPDHAA